MKKNKIKILYTLILVLIVSIMINCKTFATSSFTANVNEELSLSISNIKYTDAEWQIENTDIAKIISTGASGIQIGSYVNYTYSVDIKGISKGTTIIKLVNTNGTVLGSATITITNNTRKISFEEEAIRLEPGDEYKLTPIFDPINPDDANDIIWTSSNEEVAIVDENGNIETVGEGETTITASIGEYSATVDVTVREIPEYTLGDVNSDGKINTLDVILILQSISKKITLDEAQFLSADVNLDEKVNTLDAIEILQYISKKISNF